jgi:hypothetical protein
MDDNNQIKIDIEKIIDEINEIEKENQDLTM